MAKLVGWPKYLPEQNETPDGVLVISELDPASCGIELKHN